MPILNGQPILMTHQNQFYAMQEIVGMLKEMLVDTCYAGLQVNLSKEVTKKIR